MVLGRSALRALTWVVAVVLAGQGMSYVLFRSHPELIDRLVQGVEGQSFAEGMVWTFGALVGAALVHEIGHLLSGLAAGLRPIWLAVGPILITRVQGRIQVRWVRRIGFGGFAASVPKFPAQRHLLCRQSIAIAGGPLSSFVGGFVLLWAGVSVLGHWPAFAWFSLLLGYTSVLVGVQMLVPIELTGVPSDGARLLQFLHGGPAANRIASLMAITGLDQAGVWPGDWPRDVIDRLATDDDSSPDALSAQLSACVPALLARGDEARAERSLRSLVGRRHELLPIYVPTVFVQASYLAARRGDVVEARRLLEETPPGGLVAPSVLASAAAALDIAEGRVKEGRAAAARALEVKAPLIGQERLWRAILDALSANAEPRGWAPRAQSE